MNIVPVTTAITFPETAVAGDQITKVIEVGGVSTDNIAESATFTATLGSDSVSASVPIVHVVPDTPTFTVSSTAGASLEVTDVTEVNAGHYHVTVVATKL